LEEGTKFEVIISAVCTLVDKTTLGVKAIGLLTAESAGATEEKEEQKAQEAAMAFTGFVGTVKQFKA
jgi:hypothetical protein